MRRSTWLILLATLGLTACAYGGHAYEGREWSGPRRAYGGELSGPGLAILDDWLKETREGNVVVTMGFAEARRGFVSEDVAHRVNLWFRRYADHDRDLILTDPEIRTALVHAAGRWVRPRRASEGPGN